MAGVPWVVLIVGAGLRAVEPELEEDAAMCALPGRVVCYVTLPRTAGAIAVAALWVALVASVEISVTDFFQVRTFAEEVYTQSALGTWDDGSGFESSGSIGLWTGVALWTLVAVTAIRAARPLVVGMADTTHRARWIWQLRGLRWPAALVLATVMVVVAGVPLGNLIYKAGVRVRATDEGRVREWSVAKTLERIVGAPGEFRGELALSGAIGVAAATTAVAVAVPLAWSMRSSRGTPWIRLAALGLCLAIPGPLLGLGLIRLLNQPPGSPFAWLAWLYDSHFAPWLVQTVRALPLVTLILWAALSTVPQSMLDAAAADGSRWWGRLLRIALPQRWPAVAAAWVVGVAIAVGEVAATVLVMPPGRSTAISVRVFQLLHYGVDDRVAAISLMLVMGTAAVAAIAGALIRRRRDGRARAPNGRGSGESMNRP
jgi:ABC-type Fe3+ transport system permease subunit